MLLKCPRRDSNPHVLPDTRVWAVRGCLLRHRGIERTAGLEPATYALGRRGASCCATSACLSRPVSRVLYSLVRVTAIHLGLSLPPASCGPPAGIGRAARQLLDLAPGGVYLAALVTQDAGGLLHRRFTLTPRAGRSAFCCTLPAGHPGPALPATLPCGARTFLSAWGAAAVRPAQSGRRDLNPRPHAWQARALPAAPRPHCWPLPALASR
jgi:hypothetical protein